MQDGDVMWNRKGKGCETWIQYSMQLENSMMKIETQRKSTME